MNGTVVGFGKTENGHVSETLREVILTVVDNQTCLENDRQTYEALLTAKMYCAGGTRGVQACDGDNGDGMFFKIDEAWYVRGIRSFIAKQSSGMCDGSKYTVFTDVSKYREWITRFTSTRAWLTNLQRCEDGPIGKETVCNIANHFDHGFMLVGRGEGVTRVPLNGAPSSQVITARGLTALDRDCAEGRIYWSDIDENQILSAKYDGSDRKPLITKTLIVPFGLAVDWISRRLYWTDLQQRTVEVASLENPAIRTVLISNLENPESIAVDPVHSKLFWLHRKRDRTRWIEWSNLDGTERQLFIGDRSQLKLPISFQLSMAGGELYIIDEFDKLICIDTYTKRVRTIASGLTQPYGLAVTENQIYWTAAFTNQLESINEDGVRENPIQFSNSSANVFEIASVTSKCPVFYSPCAINNGGCPENTICLSNPRAPAVRIRSSFHQSNTERIIGINLSHLNRFAFQRIQSGGFLLKLAREQASPVALDG
ncbi:hypothetical protein ZHAS_00017735 [Anopheles sinensis]|uniref:Peptidase S1 domain-containing protein n=1 Tax=Anopheles sinensis TaxID=74873 RepID=A0A084WH36_ANOSI|nr:hypothetical protein ZHAS_00017735 [Anopheles sinensis]